MTKKIFWTTSAGLVLIALVMAGCQTYGQAGALGAATGAGLGAIIGHQSGHAGEGALIGAALGGLTGLVAHDVKARRERSAADTASAYNYQPAQGEMLRLENAQVLPSVVKAGNMAEGTMQYALLGAGANGVAVTEARQLRRGGDVLYENTQTVTRTDGTWVSTQQFELPASARPGQYTLTQSARTSLSSISSSATFTVE